jgi:hypothetical protein
LREEKETPWKVPFGSIKQLTEPLPLYQCAQRIWAAEHGEVTSSGRRRAKAMSAEAKVEPSTPEWPRQ